MVLNERSYVKHVIILSNYAETLDSISKQHYLEKLYVQNPDGDYFYLPDPYNIKKDEWKDDVSSWPKLSSSDVHHYLTTRPGRNYKSLSAYEYVVSGKVQRVDIYIPKEMPHLVLLSALVQPSQKCNEDYYSAWILCQDSGEIKSAHCTCLAGLDEACSHVAALLYKVQLGVTVGIIASSTEKRSEWNCSFTRKVFWNILECFIMIIKRVELLLLYGYRIINWLWFWFQWMAGRCLCFCKGKYPTGPCVFVFSFPKNKEKKKQCKYFFRRSIKKNAVYQCKCGNNSEIDMYMRRKSQKYRLKKRLGGSIRPECVVPEYQCAIKWETKKGQKDKDKPNSTTRDSGCDKEEKPLGGPNGASWGQGKAMSKAQEYLISRLVVYQEEYESPSEEDFKKITAFPLGDTEEDSLKRFQHINEITILTIQLIVEFSKKVPGFNTLPREDQITLLKSCSSEVMMLRTAQKYDIKTDSIVFANNQPYTCEIYRNAGMGDSADSIFQFCRNMCGLKVDNAEYALLTAIVIFSERPCLQEPKKVEKIQEFYIETLRAYISTNRPPGKNYFAQLLMTLVELRTLSNLNSELCFSLKAQQNKKLPAFLKEVWDIQQ